MRTFARKITIVIIVSFLLSCNNNDKTNNLTDKKEAAKDSAHPVTPETENAYVSVDPSPMDMSYYPTEYPKIKMDSDEMKPPVMRVIYSRPQLNDRKLFHGFLKYGEPWRLGANESTEIQFYRDVLIQNKKVNAGRYILYCIPQQDQWTIVLNSNIESWGLRQKSARDIDKFIIPVTHHNPKLEYFTMVFEKTDRGANLIIGWDEELTKLPVNF